MAPPSEPEFEQAYNEIKMSLQGLFEKEPQYQRALEVIKVPERVITFRVAWENDKGEVCVNTGYRVQQSSVLGPYKGGLRLRHDVNLSILKFLALEQIFKNALTGLAMGGGKGGSDFEPKGKSDAEIRRFCYSFMRELSRHIGDNTDIPAGDIGTTGREVGFLFGAYKQLRNEWAGILTGKGLTWGGSLIRPEATGYGTVYYVEHMLKRANWGTFKGKKVAISGSGNVAQYAALKVLELGGYVLTLSDSKGAIVSELGLTPEFIHQVMDLKAHGGYLKDMKFPDGVKYIAGVRPWTLLKEIDIVLPCATQNEVSGEEAEHLVKIGAKIVAEGSNMGSTAEAVDVFEAARAKDGSVWYGPGKAANAGGVAVSGLEMAQNSSRVYWTAEEVDNRLKGIMADCFENCYKQGTAYGKSEPLPSLLVGANIAGFLKVADAAHDQGHWW